MSAVAVSEVINVEDALSWFQGALGELYATLAAQGLPFAGPAGGIYANDLFAHERGWQRFSSRTRARLRPMGRVTSLVVPAAELATTMHTGPHTDIDRAYGALATYVTQNALAIDGPIREYYLVGPHETIDESEWRTEIGWPIFRTGRSAWPHRLSGAWGVTTYRKGAVSDSSTRHGRSSRSRVLTSDAECYFWARTAKLRERPRDEA